MAEGLYPTHTSTGSTPSNNVNPIQINQGYVIPSEIYSYFGISDEKDMMNPEIKRKLNNILAFAYEKTKGELGDLLLAIRGIENTLGQSPMNISRHDNVFKFVTIERQINDLEKQKKAYFNSPKKQDIPSVTATPEEQ